MYSPLWNTLFGVHIILKKNEVFLVLVEGKRLHQKTTRYLAFWFMHNRCLYPQAAKFVDVYR